MELTSRPEPMPAALSVPLPLVEELLELDEELLDELEEELLPLVALFNAVSRELRPLVLLVLLVVIALPCPFPEVVPP
ncbi:hypothetical protein [Dyella sp. C11]|uniref:hypothetical protein n=1 Tax=Dyella sp. C11 TaxID=2126991 RepID=UPI001E2F543C|nr:hypothetical protein [Dyella sp. C11]